MASSKFLRAESNHGLRTVVKLEHRKLYYFTNSSDEDISVEKFAHFYEKKYKKSFDVSSVHSSADNQFTDSYDKFYTVGGLALDESYLREHIKKGFDKKIKKLCKMMTNGPVKYEHQTVPIGTITKAEYVEGKGIVIEARMWGRSAFDAYSSDVSNLAKDVKLRVLEGDISQFSVGLIMLDYDIDSDDDLKFEVFEVSVVVKGARPVGDFEKVTYSKNVGNWNFLFYIFFQKITLFNQKKSQKNMEEITFCSAPSSCLMVVSKL